VPPWEIPASGETRAHVALLRLPTYEGEHIEVRLDQAFVIALTGRLNLFSSEALAKAWQSLPPPRRAVLDLTQATELSVKGVAALLEFCGADKGDGRVAIQIRAGDADQERAFAGRAPVHGERGAALAALGDLPEESRQLLTVTIRREEPVIAPLPLAKEAGKPGTASPKEAGVATQPRRRRLEVEDIGDVTVVNFVDRKILDEQNIQIIGEQLFSLVDEFGRRKIVLNFSNVEYLSSAANAKFITLQYKLQNAGGRLVLCNVSPEVHEVFEITKLEKFFRIYREEQEALQSF
jgi:anti-sigma B factor antagonist